jgi:hypothetical protein
VVGASRRERTKLESDLEAYYYRTDLPATQCSRAGSAAREREARVTSGREYAMTCRILVFGDPSQDGELRGAGDGTRSSGTFGRITHCEKAVKISQAIIVQP